MIMIFILLLFYYYLFIYYIISIHSDQMHTIQFDHATQCIASDMIKAEL